MSDLVAFGETALTIAPPDSERLETATDLRLRVDGTESNAAVAADRLGTATTWVSKLPDTPLGKRVTAALREHGLETDVVWADDAGRQSLIFRERPASPREGTTIEDRAGAAVGTAEPGELPMGLIQGAEAVLVGGSTPAVSATARETTEAIFRAATGTRVLELDYRPGLWTPGEARESLEGLLDAVDVLVASESDLKAVFDRTGEPRRMVHAVASDHDFERVVVTRSERGAVAWDDSVVHEQDAVETAVVDPAGQHDAFVGGFLHASLAGAGTERALATGVATAALSRTVPGPLPTVSAAEVERLVDELTSRGRGR